MQTTKMENRPKMKLLNTRLGVKKLTETPKNHYMGMEESTMTKYVFFGALRLKPVPHCFAGYEDIKEEICENNREIVNFPHNFLEIKETIVPVNTVIKCEEDSSDNSTEKIMEIQQLEEENEQIERNDLVYGMKVLDEVFQLFNGESNDFTFSNHLILAENLEKSSFQYDIKEKKKRMPQCKICSQVFNSYAELKTHKKEHNGENPYRCLKFNCGLYFASLEQFRGHLRSHEGKCPYICKKCDKGFRTPRALEIHEPTHVLRKLPQTKKAFKCQICGKDFRKLCDLERHTRVHTGEKPAVCGICNRRFQQVHNLNKHLLIHSQQKPFECEICNKKFGRNDVLNRHLLTHCVKKPHDCSFCLKSFIRASQLNAHLRKNHNSETREDECQSQAVC